MANNQLTAAEALKANFRELMRITSPSELRGEITRIVEGKPFVYQSKDSFWSSIAEFEGHIDSIRVYVSDFILTENRTAAD